MLALPLIVGNLAWSLIAATDLLLLGRLGPDAVASGALTINIYNAFLVFGIGLATAVSPMIARERGRKAHSVRDIRRTIRQAFWATALVCLSIWAILWNTQAILIAMGQDPALSAGAARLMRGLQWALLPYLWFVVLRNYVSALERPLWGVGIIIAALPINFLFGYVLIFGHLGAPRLGMFGAGLASTLSALFMLVSMAAIVMRDRQFRRYALFGRFWMPDRSRFYDVWRLGFPIAITLTLEVAVFNAAALIMGLIDEASLAAHAIAIQIAALCFMVPLGISQAATIRVGLAFGRGDPGAVGRAGWSAFALGVGFAALAAGVLILSPRMLVGVFLDLTNPANQHVAALAISFLGVAALFQLFDCTQAIGAGVLRGLHDTRIPMLFAAIGYWIIGVGVGTFLAFGSALAGLGIWIGLASGLAVVAMLMMIRWTRRQKLGLIE